MSSAATNINDNRAVVNADNNATSPQSNIAEPTGLGINAASGSFVMSTQVQSLPGSMAGNRDVTMITNVDKTLFDILGDAVKRSYDSADNMLKESFETIDTLSNYTDDLMANLLGQSDKYSDLQIPQEQQLFNKLVPAVAILIIWFIFKG